MIHVWDAPLQNKKLRKNRWKSIKTLILDELCKNGRHHQILGEKLLYLDLFSCLYDRKWSKTLPIHVRKRSYVSVHNCMNACVFYKIALHVGVRSSRTTHARFTNNRIGSVCGGRTVTGTVVQLL